MSNLIKCIDHGVYGVDPEDCPLCPACDQPIFAGERVTLQTVDSGPGHPDLLRLIHSECAGMDGDEDEDA